MKGAPHHARDIAMNKSAVGRKYLFASAFCLFACAPLLPSHALAADRPPHAQPAPAASGSAGISVFLLNSSGVCTAARFERLDAQGRAWVSDKQGQPAHPLADEVLAMYAVDASADPELGPGAWRPDSRATQLHQSNVRAHIEAQRLGVVLTVSGERFPGGPALANPPPAAASPANPNADSPDADDPDAPAKAAPPAPPAPPTPEPQPAAPLPAGDDLAWRHMTLGLMLFKLDELAAVQYPEGDPVDAGVVPHDDEVLLKNGDRIVGVIDSLSVAVKVEPPAGGAAKAGVAVPVTTIPTERVSSIRMANPRKVSAAPLAWLTDGTVTNLARIRDPGTLAAESAPRIVALLPQPARLVGLTALRPANVAPLGGRSYTDPPARSVNADDLALPDVSALGAGDLVFPGAMEVTYRLPPGSKRFVSTVALDDTAGVWGDCDVTISAGSEATSKLRAHLKWGQPPVPANLVISGETLTIRIEPGALGPIRDRVRLMRPVLILEKPAPKP